VVPSRKLPAVPDAANAANGLGSLLAPPVALRHALQHLKISEAAAVCQHIDSHLLPSCRFAHVEVEAVLQPACSCPTKWPPACHANGGSAAKS
jgi:hypothetical protein